MISCPIYDKNGVVKNAVIDTLELHDEWMAECYVTASVKSPVPIDFEVGDYILYRGEQYTIQYSPNLLKKAASGSYQEGFVYDNIKFVGSQDDVVRCDFNDIVLNDNEMHYTALSTFPFYCESVDDLLDRIQANLEDLYPGQWIIIGLNTVRNYQRGTAVGRASAFDEAYRTYIDPAGTAKTDPYGKQGVAESVDNITCWDAMKKVHDDFDLNFIVRGRVIVVGTAGVYTPNTFRYGRGNGLYEIERVGESDQQIITRLRAYGSSANLPQHYYATLNKQVYATITTIKNKFSTTGADFLLDLDFDKKYFTYRSESYPGTTEAPNYIIEMMANDVTVRGYVTKDAETGKCYVYCEYTGGDDDRDEPDSTKMAAFVQALTANDRLYFADYVNKDSFGDGHYDYAANHLPDNMAVSRLMLPGFPTMSLNAWVQAHKNDPDKTWLAQAIADGFTFSTELYRPYIDSPNKNQFGVRPGSIYFDGSDETDDIHPTIEGMSYNNAPIDEVYAADQVEDNGVYPAGDDVKNINITLPDLGFDLDKYYEEGASIDMKNGMCGARSFKIANKPTKDANNRWVCNVERVHDESLDLWFPYCDFQIHGSSEVGHDHGDKYVLTGIEMPDAYIASASIKLLQASIEALKKNHAPRFTFQPRIDEIWMQRQHDTATSSQGVVSLHDTLKAGDIFSFADTDLNIDENVIIDVLTIRENGNNGIPTYDITLRDEKEVSPIQKITNKVDSIISGSTNINGATGGLTVQQIRSIINNFGGAQFLSKLNDDTAQGFITMLKGLQVGNQFVSGLLGEGGVFRRDADGKVYIEADKLYVRMKAYFDNVEIKDYEHTSGNRIASKAGLKCVKVEAYNADDELIEENPQTEPTGTAYYRLYFRAKDGDDTIDNNFVVGDQAFCDKTTFDNNVLAHHRYWRLVVGKNSTLQDDEEFGYIDLSASDKESGSAVPLAGDDVSQLGNRTDVERQGAIIEFVGGENAPAYQIYQGINTYSLSNKCKIDIGFDSQTGLARMNVAGNFRFGSHDNTGSYIKYDSQANQGQGQLDIKAHVEFTNSNQELDAFVQSHQRDDSYDDTEVRGLIDGLQDQIDGQIESWFYNYAPVAVDSQGAPTSNVPSNVEPYKSWNDADVAAGNDAQKIAHLGDTFTNNKTGYCWRFTRNSSTNAFEWVIIEDSAVITALQNAARAQDTADHKRRVFLSQPVPPYDAGDMWVNATYPANYTGVTDEANHNYNNDILKCVTAKASDGSFSINDWALASKYTDDSKFNGYISALLNNTGLSGDSAAAAVQNAILGALGVGTVVAGGLLLTSLIGMRQYNGSGDKSDVSNYTTWAGISGQYNANVLGGGMAAWYGGGMLDKETLTTQQISQGWNTLRWAKGVDRFDGSGYRADGNISWNANGALTIKNITTLSDSNNNNILNELATFNSAFTFGTSGQGSTTALYITPQVPFESLYIGTSNADKQEVATKNWVNQNFVTTTFFDNLFRLYNGYGNSATQINVNGTLPTDKTNLNIEAMFGFWTKKYISALGQGDDGSTSYTTLAQLNDVTLTNPTANQVLSYNGTHWVNRSIELGSQTLADLTDVVITSPAANQMLGYDATNQKWINVNVPETYTLPAASTTALGGIKIGYGGTTAKTYAVVLDSGNKAYVSVPWENTWTAWAGATSTAAGTAGYMPAPTSAQRNQFLRGDGTWVSLNNYSLPTASADTLGGVKIGTTLAIASGVLNLPTTGVTAGTYKRVTVDAYGRVTSGDNSDTDTNTWRNIYVGGTSKVGTGIDTKAINFKAGSNVAISYVAAGTGSGQSGSANYFDVVISATDTTYSAATQSVAGLMSAADKKKLDGVAANANNYSLPLAASGTRGGVQIGYSETNSGSDTTRNYAVQLSSEKMFVNVPWVNTWRGIQDNLTSTSTTDSLSAAQGKALKGYIDTLNGYFSNGVAKSAAKLTTVSKTLFGNTYWTSGGVPISIGVSGSNASLSYVQNITMSGYIKIGDAYLSYDSTNNAIRVSANADGTGAMNFYARGGVSALGETADGQAGVGDVTWALLADGTDTRQIALSHLTTSLTTITGGTTDATNKRYAVYKNSSNQLFVDVPWTAGSGTVTSVKVGTTSYNPTNGVISLPAYPTSLPASDVYTWAKQSTKPTYAYSEITGTPTIPAAANNGTFSIKTLVGSTTTTISDFTANQSTADDFTLVQGANVTFTLDTTNRKLTIKATDTTYESKAAASGGTAVSLVTTGEKYVWNSKAAGDHTHTTSIATSTAANQLTLAFGSKYAITAGGTSYVFTMPSNPNTNTTYKFTIGSTTKGDATNGVDLGTLKSETAAASGTTLSLVTTGEKYSWNNKTYTTSIATDSGTNQLTLAFGTKYKLTAGGTSFVFTMPSNPDTDVNVKVNNTNPTTGTWYYPVWYTATSGTGNVNANDGFRYYSLQGTASALGESYLQIGNSTASGTAGNKRGHLRIYGNKAYYGEFNMVDDLTANKTYTFSDEGTVLTSGNSSVSLSGQTLTVKINGVSKSLTNSTYTLAGLMGSSAKGSTTQPIYWTGSAFANTTYTLGKSVPSNAVFTDHYDWSDITNKPLTLTKNTTGFSISGGTTSKTLTVSESYTLGAACAKGVTDNSSNADVTSSDTNLITGRTLYYQLAKKGYTTNTGTVTSVATGTGLTGGTITTSGTISINSTYQTYISHGESAYNSLGNYLPLSGGTMTGAITAKANQNEGDYGINMNNSDIVGLNSIYTADLADNWREGIEFKRTNGNYDSFRAADGTFYFGANNGIENGSANIGSASAELNYVYTNNIHSGNNRNLYLRGAYAVVFSPSNTQKAYFNGNGSLILQVNNDADPSSWNNPALSIGDYSGAHIEIDNNEIMSKSNATTTDKLYINAGGGGVLIGSDTTDTYLQIGLIKIQYDSTNNALKVIKSDGSAANLYATGGISALGAGQESGGGGGSYLPLSGGTLTGALNVYASSGRSTIRNISSTNNPTDLEFGSNGTRYWSISSRENNDKRLILYSTNTDDYPMEVDWSSGVVFARYGLSIGTNLPHGDAERIELKLVNPDDYPCDFVLGANGRYNWSITPRGSNQNYSFGIYNNNTGVTAYAIWINGNNNYVGIKQSSASYPLHVSGAVGATGFTNTSDIRKKNVIKDVDLRLDQIAKAPAFEYYWLDPSIDHDLHVGTSAQYWESVLPQVVTTAKDEMGTKAMQYGVTALVSTITVARKVMTHEEKIALLETRVSALEKENGELIKEIEQLKIA